MPDGLKDSADSQPVKTKSGHTINIVRVTVKRTAGAFTLSQLRLICKEKNNAKAVYPIGYLKSANLLQRKTLDEIIELKDTENIDLAFYVPNNYAPALVEFKLNNIAEVSSRIAADQCPNPLPLVFRLCPTRIILPLHPNLLQQSRQSIQRRNTNSRLKYPLCQGSSSVRDKLSNHLPKRPRGIPAWRFC